MFKNQNHLGGICMILSVLFFSLMDVLIKITYKFDVGQVMFSRALFGFIPIFFLIPKKNLKIFIKQNIKAYIFIDPLLVLLQCMPFL